MDGPYLLREEKGPYLLLAHRELVPCSSESGTSTKAAWKMQDSRRNGCTEIEVSPQAVRTGCSCASKGKASGPGSASSFRSWTSGRFLWEQPTDTR